MTVTILLKQQQYQQAIEYCVRQHYPQAASTLVLQGIAASTEFVDWPDLESLLLRCLRWPHTAGLAVQLITRLLLLRYGSTTELVALWQHY